MRPQLRRPLLLCTAGSVFFVLTIAAIHHMRATPVAEFGSSQPGTDDNKFHNRGTVGNEVGSNADGADGLQFDQPLVDRGNCKGRVEHQFHFVNRTGDPITIESVRAGCVCTIIKPPTMTIPQNGRDAIGVQIDLTLQSRGFHRYVVEVTYSSGSRTMGKRLELHLQNDPEAFFAPQELTLTSLRGEPAEGLVTLTDFRSQRASIEHIDCSTPWLTVECVQQPQIYQAGWRYVLRARCDPTPLPVGHHTAQVSVLLAGADRPLTLPLSYRVTERVSCSPRVLVLGGATESVVVTLTDRKVPAEEIVIESAVTNVSNVTCEPLKAEQRAPGSRQLRVSLNRQMSPRDSLPSSVTLTITLRQPCHEQLSVPILLR